MQSLQTQKGIKISEERKSQFPITADNQPVFPELLVTMVQKLVKKQKICCQLHNEISGPFSTIFNIEAYSPGDSLEVLRGLIFQIIYSVIYLTLKGSQSMIFVV